MKNISITAISDLHGHFPQLEGGDLLIVAGDVSNNEQYDRFFDWLAMAKYRKKIYIAGNHDNNLFEGKRSTDKHCDAIYLCDSGTEFEGLKIWGSPWTKTFEGMNPHCKAFTLDTEEELFDKWELIPPYVDILITHSPPWTILDKTIDGRQVGSTGLMGQLIYSFRPKLWVFGHIHESYGKEVFRDSTICVNASHVNEQYQPVNKPIRIEL